LKKKNRGEKSGGTVPLNKIRNTVLMSNVQTVSI
jgi:hypothetical protein